MGENLTVIPEWFGKIKSLQQQSVILLALRGPDGVRKHHPCKHIVRAYRGSVILAAYKGRQLEYGEVSDSFMCMDVIGDDAKWESAVKDYFDSVDELPHHYHLHLLHGSQLVGMHHPDYRIANKWYDFYVKGCHDLHLNPETLLQVAKRLNDGDREGWNK